MSEKQYRVAVVGGAGMWGRHYLQTFAQREDCSVVLVDPSERAREFAGHFGVVEVLDTLEELLKRETPDIVANILPVRLSRDAVIACAEAGVKAVSCEKPMAVELSVADEMVRVCQEREYGLWLCYGLLGGSVFTRVCPVATRGTHRSTHSGRNSRRSAARGERSRLRSANANAFGHRYGGGVGRRMGFAAGTGLDPATGCTRTRNRLSGLRSSGAVRGYCLRDPSTARRGPCALSRVG